MSGSKERPESNPLEVPSLPTLVGLQEETATTVSTYIGDQIGDLYFSGRKVKIEAVPGSFYLTFKDTDRSTIVFSMQSIVSKTQEIESKYSLSYITRGNDFEHRTTDYRFNQNAGIKTYQNGHANDELSDMQEEDFLKVRNMLNVIRNFFLELIPSR